MERLGFEYQIIQAGLVSFSDNNHWDDDKSWHKVTGSSRGSNRLHATALAAEGILEEE